MPSNALISGTTERVLIQNIQFIPGEPLFNVGTETEWYRCGWSKSYELLKRYRDCKHFEEMYWLGFFSLPQKLHPERIWEDTTGYVYFIRYRDTNAYKVGRSTAPTFRLGQLRKDAQCEGIHLSFYIKSPNYKRTEALIHDALSSRRLGGEWFDLSPYQNHLQAIVLGS